MMLQRLLGSARGAAATEFALVAPTFLMMIFVMLDGGRMLFTKQALNELAAAGARCSALKATGCATTSAAQTWIATRGQQRSMLSVSSAMVTVDQTSTTTCNGQTGNMAKVTIVMPYNKSGMNLLPQSVVPSNLTSISCFPAA